MRPFLKYCLVLLFLFAGSFKAQVNIDSLRNVWKNPKTDDKSRFKAIYNFSWEFLDSYPDSARYYAEQMLAYAKKKKRILQESNALSVLGNYYLSVGDHGKAFSCFTSSMKILESNDGSESALGAAYNDLGMVLATQEEYEKAVAYYNKSIKIFKKLKDEMGVASLLTNIGACYDAMGKNEEALNYYNKTLEVGIRLKDDYIMAGSYINIGVSYLHKDEYKQATVCFEKALALNKQMNHLPGICNSLNNLAEVCYYEGNPKKALPYLLESRELAKSINSVQQIMECSKSLCKVYEELGEYKKSLETREVMIKMRDSISGEDSKKEVLREEFKYTYEKKATADSVMAVREKHMATEKNRKNALVRYALIGFLVLVLVFGLFMFNRFRQARVQKAIIIEKKKEAELQKMIIEEKQKHIMDSIHYAKRIQDALLASPKYIQRNIDRLKK
jgi:tetratricopeptide (TPR) repeat protein